MLRQRSLNHTQKCVIIKIVILHPLCLSNSTVTGEVGHDVPSLLPMSHSAYAFVSVLSSNLYRKHRFRPSGAPIASLSGLSSPKLVLSLLFMALSGQLPSFPELYWPVLALSSLSAVLSGGIWAFSGVSSLSIYCLALSGHTIKLSGLLPLCLGECFPVEALFGPTVTLTRLRPPYLALPWPAVAHPGLPLHCLVLFFSSKPEQPDMFHFSLRFVSLLSSLSHFSLFECIFALNKTYRTNSGSFSKQSIPMEIWSNYKMIFTASRYLKN